MHKGIEKYMKLLADIKRSHEEKYQKIAMIYGALPTPCL